MKADRQDACGLNRVIRVGGSARAAARATVRECPLNQALESGSSLNYPEAVAL